MLEQFFDTIRNERPMFPFRLIFITVNDSSDIIVQLFVLRDIKWYKAIRDS